MTPELIEAVTAAVAAEALPLWMRAGPDDVPPSVEDGPAYQVLLHVGAGAGAGDAARRGAALFRSTMLARRVAGAVFADEALARRLQQAGVEAISGPAAHGDDPSRATGANMALLSLVAWGDQLMPASVAADPLLRHWWSALAAGSVAGVSEAQWRALDAILRPLASVDEAASNGSALGLEALRETYPIPPGLHETTHAAVWDDLWAGLTLSPAERRAFLGLWPSLPPPAAGDRAVSAVRHLMTVTRHFQAARAAGAPAVRRYFGDGADWARADFRRAAAADPVPEGGLAALRPDAEAIYAGLVRAADEAAKASSVTEAGAYRRRAADVDRIAALIAAVLPPAKAGATGDPKAIAEGLLRRFFVERHLLLAGPPDQYDAALYGYPRSHRLDAAAHAMAEIYRDVDAAETWRDRAVEAYRTHGPNDPGFRQAAQSYLRLSGAGGARLGDSTAIAFLAAHPEALSWVNPAAFADTAWVRALVAANPQVLAFLPESLWIDSAILDAAFAGGFVEGLERMPRSLHRDEAVVRRLLQAGVKPAIRRLDAYDDPALRFYVAALGAKGAIDPRTGLAVFGMSDAEEAALAYAENLSPEALRPVVRAAPAVYPSLPDALRADPELTRVAVAGDPGNLWYVPEHPGDAGEAQADYAALYDLALSSLEPPALRRSDLRSVPIPSPRVALRRLVARRPDALFRTLRDEVRRDPIVFLNYVLNGSDHHGRRLVWPLALDAVSPAEAAAILEAEQTVAARARVGLVVPHGAPAAAARWAEARRGAPASSLETEMIRWVAAYQPKAYAPLLEVADRRPLDGWDPKRPGFGRGLGVLDVRAASSASATEADAFRAAALAIEADPGALLRQPLSRMTHPALVGRALDLDPSLIWALETRFGVVSEAVVRRALHAAGHLRQVGNTSSERALQARLIRDFAPALHDVRGFIEEVASDDSLPAQAQARLLAAVWRRIEAVRPSSLKALAHDEALFRRLTERSLDLLPLAAPGLRAKLLSSPDLLRAGVWGSEGKLATALLPPPVDAAVPARELPWGDPAFTSELLSASRGSARSFAAGADLKTMAREAHPALLEALSLQAELLAHVSPGDVSREQLGRLLTENLGLTYWLDKGQQNTRARAWRQWIRRSPATAEAYEAAKETLRQADVSDLYAHAPNDRVFTEMVQSAVGAQSADGRPRMVISVVDPALTPGLWLKAAARYGYQVALQKVSSLAEAVAQVEAVAATGAPDIWFVAAHGNEHGVDMGPGGPPLDRHTSAALRPALAAMAAGGRVVLPACDGGYGGDLRANLLQSVAAEAEGFGLVVDGIDRPGNVAPVWRPSDLPGTPGQLVAQPLGAGVQGYVVAPTPAAPGAVDALGRSVFAGAPPLGAVLPPVERLLDRLNALVADGRAAAAAAVEEDEVAPDDFFGWQRAAAYVEGWIERWSSVGGAHEVWPAIVAAATELQALRAAAEQQMLRRSSDEAGGGSR